MREGSSDDLVLHHMSFCSSQCEDSIAKNGDSMSSEGEMKVGLSYNSVGDMKKKGSRSHHDLTDYFAIRPCGSEAHQ
jgi:hypothetical protein